MLVYCIAAMEHHEHCTAVARVSLVAPIHTYYSLKCCLALSLGRFGRGMFSSRTVKSPGLFVDLSRLQLPRRGAKATEVMTYRADVLCSIC